ncbi:alpha/beta hydrolase [Ruficoccus sp. ZRK36]|uniref:alpha/beta hydrolase n=1 Tax=Ruficoccus sp. ZRK36 TaxID=2866311 RepID=UPI001C735F8B|nr:alpha/beta hydrolase [Ruficoccus sp. ZRK36]QYY34317.1 alpha/beta hydrolase [Ruficoccus sp. ZRK36]
MYQRINDISFADDLGTDGKADLFLPDNPRGAPAALLIHGGGWVSMEKTSIEPIARLLAEHGYAVFNINYRLTATHPWPACGDDCIRGAKFLMDAGHPAMRELDLDQIDIVGGSAGGHLALMAGLRLPLQRVRSILNLSGITDVALWQTQFCLDKPEFWEKFTGGPVEEAFLRDASPRYYVSDQSPPLNCIHSENDQLVTIEHADIIEQAYRAVNRPCEVFRFDGPGDKHGLFQDGAGEANLADRTLVPEVRDAILRMLAKHR